MSLTDLPVLNAILNCTSATFLTLGYFAIRRQDRGRHKFLMLSAAVTSTLFLASYLVYHFNVGSVPYKGLGAARTLYFTILISHTLLASSLPVLVPITMVRALRARFDKHVQIARITLPIWFYVSVTGVAIYFMLYVE